MRLQQLQSFYCFDHLPLLEHPMPAVFGQECFPFAVARRHLLSVIRAVVSLYPTGKGNVLTSRTETQTLTEWINLYLMPTLSWVPTGRSDYKLTENAVDMMEDVSQDKEVLFPVLI